MVYSRSNMHNYLVLIEETRMHISIIRLSRAISKCTAALATVCALIMIFSLLDGVFFRYVFNSAPAWTDEVAILAFSWCTLLFASVLVQEQGHVRITVLLSAFPVALERFFDKASVVLVLLFSLLLIWAGWQFVEFTADQVSPTLRYPLWLQSAAVPASGVLIFVHSLALLMSSPDHHQTQGEAS